MKEDGLEAVREELVKATPELTKKILEDLDKLVAENTRFVKMEILNEIKEELKKSVQSAIEPINWQVKLLAKEIKPFSPMMMLINRSRLMIRSLPECILHAIK